MQFMLFVGAFFPGLLLVDFMPPSDELLAEFLVFQSATCVVASLKVYLYAIRAFVKEQGYEFKPWRERYAVYSTVMGLKRLFGDETSQKLAVTPELLLNFCCFINPSDFCGVMLWGSFLVAFFGLFRKDNITVGKASAFNPRANLTVGDFTDDGEDVIWVRVNHSKVIQFGQRSHWVPLVAMEDHPLCPVSAVRKVLALHASMGSSPDAPMFLWRRGNSRKVSPMTHSVFVGEFKSLVTRVGLDWKAYAGHSFRRGGATYCFNLGVCPDLIKMLGDWKSDAYLLYDETTVARRLELPRAMVEAISNGILHHGPRLV